MLRWQTTQHLTEPVDITPEVPETPSQKPNNDVRYEAAMEERRRDVSEQPMS